MSAIALRRDTVGRCYARHDMGVARVTRASHACVDATPCTVFGMRCKTSPGSSGFSLWTKRVLALYSLEAQADGREPRTGPKPDGILPASTEEALGSSLMGTLSGSRSRTVRNGAPAYAGGGLATHAQSRNVGSRNDGLLTGGQHQLTRAPARKAG